MGGTCSPISGTPFNGTSLGAAMPRISDALQDEYVPGMDREKGVAEADNLKEDGVAGADSDTVGDLVGTVLL